MGLIQGRETIASFSLAPLTLKYQGLIQQRKSFAVIFDFLQRNHILINEVLIPKSACRISEKDIF
ncbi:MAG: hypothetical protein C4B58_05185 [Deltaproteobacteria bacterium]|nr:MAG: hypothetical protein C4B58_05185 [Deltaproteobacteria bacterium]